ncbi:MAG: hypothetical protein ACPGR8_10300 [Limisphaerales bacterium]
MCKLGNRTCESVRRNWPDDFCTGFMPSSCGEFAAKLGCGVGSACAGWAVLRVFKTKTV